MNYMKAKTTNENGCTVPWVMNTKNICKKKENMNETYWIAYKRVLNRYEDCPTPCHSISANLGTVL